MSQKKIKIKTPGKGIKAKKEKRNAIIKEWTKRKNIEKKRTQLLKDIQTADDLGFLRQDKKNENPDTRNENAIDTGEEKRSSKLPNSIIAPE